MRLARRGPRRRLVPANDAISDDVAAHCDDRRLRRETKLDLGEIGRKGEEIIVKKNQDREIARDIEDCIALRGQPARPLDDDKRIGEVRSFRGITIRFGGRTDEDDIRQPRLARKLAQGFGQKCHDGPRLQSQRRF
jgi:hypothetical protein